MKTWEIMKEIDSKGEKTRGRKYKMVKGILKKYGDFKEGDIAKIDLYAHGFF